MEFDNETLRRLRVYAPRLMRMCFNKKLKHNCCYMHVPKSGGSSVHEALRSVIPFNNHIGAIDAISTRRAAGVIFAGKNDITTVHEDGPRCSEIFQLREYQLMIYMAQQMSLIYGHFLFSETANKYFGESYKFITILRDPVTRVVSNYRSAKFENFIERGLDNYLSSEVAKRHARVNLRYFSGIAELKDEDCESALKLAKTNLDKFSIIGFMEKLDLFCEHFQYHFSVKPKIYHYNSAKGNEVDLTQQQIDKIEELCAYDNIIYEYAYSKFS